MLDLVAKRYVKALIKASSKDELQKYNELLQILNRVFENDQVRTILNSPEISEIKKANFLIDVLKSAQKELDKKFENFLKLLAEKKRINLIPTITKELKREIDRLNNIYEGKIYSEVSLSKREIKNLENILSQKVGSKIVLHRANQKYDGMKIDIDPLGMEISFSKSKVKNDLIEHILKAI